jgi:hypothetical protein
MDITQGYRLNELEDWDKEREESTGGEKNAGITSHERTTCDNREFLRSLDLVDDQFADAGVTGVLKIGVVGDTMEEVEDDIAEETVDSPTKVFSLAVIPGYSKLEVSPSPMGFQESL